MHNGHWIRGGDSSLSPDAANNEQSNLHLLEVDYGKNTEVNGFVVVSKWLSFGKSTWKKDEF